MSDHPILKYISDTTWAFVEPHVSPYAKDKIAQVIDFVEVRYT
jgi:hypothetical protein